MLLGLSLLFVLYVFICISLVGLAEMAALNKYKKPILRDVIMDMLSQPFYIVWFLPWWLLLVTYRLVQMRQAGNLPRVELAMQEDKEYTLPRAEPITRAWPEA